MKANLVKTGVFCLGGVLGSAMALVPAQAFANGLGWGTNILDDAQLGGDASISSDQMTPDKLAGWVKSVTTWALGIAVVLFVLKVVLTAIDRMVFDPDKGGSGGGPGGGPGGGGGRGGGRQGSGESILSKIPFIGAYDPTMSWKEIWKSFGKNIAIVAGAWVIVQIVVSFVMFAFGQVEVLNNGS